MLRQRAQRHRAVERDHGGHPDHRWREQGDGIPAQRHPPAQAPPSQVRNAVPPADDRGHHERGQRRAENVLGVSVQRCPTRQQARLRQPGDKGQHRDGSVDEHQERPNRVPDDHRPKRRQVERAGRRTQVRHDPSGTVGAWPPRGRRAGRSQAVCRGPRVARCAAPPHGRHRRRCEQPGEAWAAPCVELLFAVVGQGDRRHAAMVLSNGQARPATPGEGSSCEKASPAGEHWRSE